MDIDYKIIAYSHFVHHPERSVVQYVFYNGEKGVVLAEASYLDLMIAGEEQFRLIFDQVRENPFSFQELLVIALQGGQEIGGEAETLFGH